MLDFLADRNTLVSAPYRQDNGEEYEKATGKSSFHISVMVLSPVYWCDAVIETCETPPELLLYGGVSRGTDAWVDVGRRRGNSSLPSVHALSRSEMPHAGLVGVVVAPPFVEVVGVGFGVGLDEEGERSGL